MKHQIYLLLAGLLWSIDLQAQSPTGLSGTFYLQEILVQGAVLTQPASIIELSGLHAGHALEIPDQAWAAAIRRLWNTNLFADLAIEVHRQRGDSLWIRIQVQERPRLTQYRFPGLRPGRIRELQKILGLKRGMRYSPALAVEIKRKIRNYYVQKGYYQCQITLVNRPDKLLALGMELIIQVRPGPKMRLHSLVLEHGQAFSEKQLRKALRPVVSAAPWQFWRKARLRPQEWNTAQQRLLEAYQSAGYLDARIAEDTVWAIRNELHAALRIDAGQRYYHRDIHWQGGQQVGTDTLRALLDIERGAPFDPQRLERRLHGDLAGQDLSGLYQDQGYLFFHVDAAVAGVEGDSVDLLIRLTEGPRARVRNVSVVGNTKTSEHVILRELMVQPGDTFSRAAIIRSQRKLTMLSYFNPEKLLVHPKPDPETGTVDLRFEVEEQASDRIQFQAGWSAPVKDEAGEVVAGGLTGTLQLHLNNFSLRRALRPTEWRPIPYGDGQGLSFSYQTSGRLYQNFQFSFQEPWLGGKRPTFLGLSAGFQRYSLQADSNGLDFRNGQFFASLDLGTRLGPKSLTRFNTSLGYKRFAMRNPGRIYEIFEGESQATLHAFTWRLSLDRNTLNHPAFPTDGTQLSASVELTPPYSLFRRGADYASMPASEKYQFLEYHKWRISVDHYTNPIGKLVLRAKAEMGYLGAYHPELGDSPFERFVVGGYGLQGGGYGGLMGLDWVPLRGYDAPTLDQRDQHFTLYQRFTLEARHPLLGTHSPVPVWLLGFAEAGNGYDGWQDYQAFHLRKSVGVGLRLQVPALGLIGLDWGYGFDANPGQEKPSGSKLHISFGRDF